MSPERRRHIPEWDEDERLRDLAWLTENLPVFLPAALAAYAGVGRGAIVVDTTEQPSREGHPFGYFPQQLIVAFGDPDAIRMVAEYEPGWQVVTMLLKSSNRVSTFRIGLSDPGRPPGRELDG